MKRFVLLVICILCLPRLSAAAQDDWPKMVKTAKHADAELCSDMFKIAKVQFYSHNFTLHRLMEFPEDIKSTPILVAKTEGISGGDALKEDGSVLQKIHKNDQDDSVSRSIYW